MGTKTKEEPPLAALLLPQVLGTQTAADVREDVVDLLPDRRNDDDNNNCDEDENQSIFDHALTFLTVFERRNALAQADEQRAQH